MGTLEMTPTTAVVVTGGASGIGLGSARALAAVGRPVVIWDLDGGAASEQAAAIGTEFDVRAVGAAVDVRHAGELAAAVERARAAVGPIGALVHAAGVSGAGPVDDITEQRWDAVLDVNLRAEMFLVQALLPELRSNPGSAVVGIASIAAFIGYEAVPAYCASKAGLLGLTRSLALSLAKDGVRVNAVCPGYIETPMIRDSILATEQSRASREAITPLGRLGQPEDIANMVRYLLSDQASFVTGQQFVVDGGVLARTM